MIEITPRKLFAIAAALLAANAWAQVPKGAVESRLEARRVVTAADGKETFAAADAARPGDVIEYVATYTNTTRAPVRNFAATLPIPGNTEFVPGSQKPAAAKASVDTITYADLPLKRKVVVNGATVEQAVPPSEYRALRWQANELAGEKSLTFTARVRVLDDRVTGPPPGAQGGGK